MNRRQFIAGLLALPAAPLIAKAERLLPEPKRDAVWNAAFITKREVDELYRLDLEQRKFRREQIARIFCVPPHMLGDVISTYNAESTYAAAFDI